MLLEIHRTECVMFVCVCVLQKKPLASIIREVCDG